MNQKKILIVEDEKALNEAIRLKLAKMGIKPIPAFSAEEAFEILKKEDKPDLIWLDVLLPGMNGINFLEAVRKDPKYKDVKAVIVSVSGGVEKKEKAEKLGILDYIVKSNYPIETIVNKVGSLA